MGFPGFISFSSGKSRYRKAGLGTGEGSTSSRIRVSGFAPSSPPRQGTATRPAAIKATRIRPNVPLRKSEISSVDDNCKTSSRYLSSVMDDEESKHPVEGEFRGCRQPETLT